MVLRKESIQFLLLLKSDFQKPNLPYVIEGLLNNSGINKLLITIWLGDLLKSLKNIPIK